MTMLHTEDPGAGGPGGADGSGGAEGPDGAGGGQLSPGAVRRMQFARAPLGRRGLLESEVDRFLARIADELSHSDAAKADLRVENGRLREEVQRLHDYFRDRRIDPEGADQGPRRSAGRAVDAQAINLMSRAQQAADQHVAQAEQYARQLLGDARLQYEEILLAAHAQAEAAAVAAGELYRQTTVLELQSGEQAELTARIAYLRTFTTVTQVQMRSILDALSGELDQLTAAFSAPGSPSDRSARVFDLRDTPGAGAGAGAGRRDRPATDLARVQDRRQDRYDRPEQPERS
jgi:cell division initiation protein